MFAVKKCQNTLYMQSKRLDGDLCYDLELLLAFSIRKRMKKFKIVKKARESAVALVIFGLGLDLKMCMRSKIEVFALVYD